MSDIDDDNDSINSSELSFESSLSNEELDEIAESQPLIKESKMVVNLPEHLKSAINRKLKMANLNMVNTAAIQRCGDISYGAQPTIEVTEKLKSLAEEKSFIIKIFIEEVRQKKCPIGINLQTTNEFVYLHDLEGIELYLKDMEYLISKENEISYD